MPEPAASRGRAATKFCSRCCRNTASKRATQTRLAAGPTIGQAWPPEVDELTYRMHLLENERQFASPDQRQRIGHQIRTLTAQLEAAKLSAMQAEGMAA